jgi:endonuclease/exonuclease/phosphatase family metal-dependent hydrolase
MNIGLCPPIFVFALIFYIACSKESMVTENSDVTLDDIQITRYGSDISFDIVTWNIEHFPKNKTYTIPYLKKIVNDIDVDLFAIQEIDDSELFYTLMDSLVEFDGFVSILPSYGQRLGIIYKSDFISITDPFQIFVDDDWAFPRPPLVTYVTVKKKNNTVFDFTLIILHLKAFGDEESEGRRREACLKLKNYIDTILLPSADKDVIVLGDYNDELTDPKPDNIFQVFISDSLDYEFLTMVVADQPTYIGSYNSAIDHILISADSRSEFSGGNTQILNIDQEFSGYLNYISDHRPVLAQFFVF